MSGEKTTQEILETSTQRSDSRCGFLLKVRKEVLAEYLDIHQHVWEEMRQALTAAGWRNYSLFVDPPTGVVFGYFEADDVRAAMKRMDSQQINRIWQSEMSRFFVQPDGGVNHLLSQYFYLK